MKEKRSEATIGRPLQEPEDIPTFWCWDDRVRFDVTGREAHADHDTTLRTLPELKTDTTLREVEDADTGKAT